MVVYDLTVTAYGIPGGGLASTAAAAYGTGDFGMAGAPGGLDMTTAARGAP